MAIPRRLWCSNIILGYLAGYQLLETECDLIIAAANRGDVEIVVSTMAEAEVAYLDGYASDESEARIREFFSRPYVVLRHLTDRLQPQRLCFENGQATLSEVAIKSKRVRDA